jgi:aspartyl-tRNA(Asn)/glutamyl-tRNA(Gln) amidotransferase subunit C
MSEPAITRDEVAHLAQLARIELTDAELELLAPQLAQILESVAVVRSVTGDVAVTPNPIPIVNVFRDDVARPGLTADQALAGAPLAEQQRFSVPRILGEEP